MWLLKLADFGLSTEGNFEYVNEDGETVNLSNTFEGGGGTSSIIFANSTAAKLHRVCKAPYRGSTPEFRSPEVEELLDKSIGLSEAVGNDAFASLSLSLSFFLSPIQVCGVLQ
jgi:hypothetical protein